MKNKIDLLILILILMGMAIAMLVLWQVSIINYQLKLVVTNLNAWGIYEEIDY